MPIFLGLNFREYPQKIWWTSTSTKELDSFLNMDSNIPKDSWLISRTRDDDGHMTFCLIGETAQSQWCIIIFPIE